MRLLRILAVFILVCGFLSSTVGCSTSGDHQDIPLNLEGQWAESNLTSQSISRIKVSNAILYASTSKGLYKQERSLLRPAWQSMGLQESEVIDFIILDNGKILAGIKLPNIESNLTSLFLTTNGGEEWIPYQQNFGGKNHYNWLTALSHHPDNPSILYAKAGALTVAKSTDIGESWQLVSGSWEPQAGFSKFLQIDQKNPDNIWSGGASPTFSPKLIKSTDAGDTWQRLTILENVETSVYDLVSHPADKNTVIAALGIGIRKSTDGGQSWTTTFDRAGVLALAHSERDGRIVYAAGGTPDGRLSFFATGDFGDTWKMVEMQDSPAGIRVNDMVSVMEDGQEVLYLGTNKGVYSYRFEE